MDISAIIGIIIVIVVVIILFASIRNWVRVYNKFQYWITRAQRKFNDIDVVMQERLDNIHALAQVVKKYDIHEYKSLKDIIEARSRWTKDANLNEKVKLASQIENSYFKLQAIFEKYPQLKADKLHKMLISRDTAVERRLRKARLGYNRVAQQYNERTKRFPRNVVAKVHGFNILEYLKFLSQADYEPKSIFD